MEYTKTEIIPQMVLTEELLCPQCHKGDVQLSGVWERGFEEVRAGGKVVSQELDKFLSMNVHEMICINCKTQYLVMDNEIFKKEVEQSAIIDNEKQILKDANKIPKEQLN